MKITLRFVFLIGVFLTLGTSVSWGSTLVPGGINVNNSGVIYSSGMVGIGTVLPLYTLVVVGSGGSSHFGLCCNIL
jgi:hypothetical protein